MWSRCDSRPKGQGMTGSMALDYIIVGLLGASVVAVASLIFFREDKE